MRPAQERSPAVSRAQPRPGLPGAICEPGCEPAVAHVLDAPVIQHTAGRHRPRHQAEVPEFAFLRRSELCAELLLVARAIDTIMGWQHPDGGFGGGPGQAAHLLPTYASVCSLAIVGRPGPGGGWDQINRCAGSLYINRTIPPMQ